MCPRGLRAARACAITCRVLEALLQDRTASAMYIFPTKALAQDQRRALGRLVPRSARLRCEIFDGDTPTPERGGIRRSARLLITNPDMLHVGILPHHRLWYQRLRSLRYVVIDEGACVSGRVRLACSQHHQAAAAHLREVWQQAAVHTLLRDDRQSGRACGAADGIAFRGR